LLDPTAYTGLCADMAREGASRARDAATGLLKADPAMASQTLGSAMASQTRSSAMESLK